MLRTTLVITALLCATVAFAQDSRPVEKTVTPEVTVPTWVNANCPIMAKPASAALFVDTTFGRIYVCCAGCNKPMLFSCPA